MEPSTTETTTETTARPRESEYPPTRPGIKFVLLAAVAAAAVIAYFVFT